MKIEKLQVSESRIDAEIKMGFFKRKKISIPTRKMMYVFSDPNNWDELSNKSLEGVDFHDLARAIYDMNRNDTNTLCEVILKIAGEHPNAYENAAFRQMMANRN